MNTMLSFLDKIYSNDTTLKIVYIVGAALLLLFIIILIINVRSTDKKEKEKIIEEPRIDKDETPIKEELKEEKIQDISVEQKLSETKIIPLDEIREKELESKEETIEEVEDKVSKSAEEIKEEQIIEPETEIKEEKVEEPKIEITDEDKKNISSELPNIDEYVDNIVKKTYEKNEQFSSVYVEDNKETNLDTVLTELNIDKEVKAAITDQEENNEITEETVHTVEETTTEIKEEKPVDNTSLDNLKKALENKQNEVKEKQDDLKAKLENLKAQKGNTQTGELKVQDLLNKLNK